jgi:superkiller protein 3
MTTQAAVHNTLPTLEEVISLTEAEEEGVFRREIEKRRTRLGASSPEQLRKEVFKEISTESKVCIFLQSFPVLLISVSVTHLLP